MSNENNIDENAQKEYDKENHPNTILYRKLQVETAKLKQDIIAHMEKMHFTEEEKKEIINIIEYHSLLKEAAKTPLIRINENCILDEVENKVLDNGKKIADNMLKVLNAKMQEIIDRKKNK